MKDIQSLMRAELERPRPAPGRKTPSSITVGPAWVAACFQGERPRFLCKGRDGWTVVLDPTRAHPFENEEQAMAAAADFGRRHRGAFGENWAAREMTLTASFR